MYILISILAVGFLIAFHEFGHMWVAKRMGIRVKRFSIGFGPVLFAWQWGETEYVLSAIPFGGYVAVAGQAGDDDPDIDEVGSLRRTATWRRFLYIAAGPAANYLLAFVLGVGLLIAGLQEPNYHTSRIGDVEADAPASKAGLLPGDEVRAVNGVEVHEWQAMRDAITTAATAHPQEPLPVVVVRGDQMHTLMIKPGEGYRIGVAPVMTQLPGMSFFQAVPQAGRNIWDQSLLIGQMVWKRLHGDKSINFTGPLGIVSQTAEQAKKGAMDLLRIVWAISVSIGFLNLLPVPFLDGGRIMFLAYEAISRRPLNERVEETINLIGAGAVILLMVFATYGDIMKKFHG